jgi:hypothetical protein
MLTIEVIAEGTIRIVTPGRSPGNALGRAAAGDTVECDGGRA